MSWPAQQGEIHKHSYRDTRANNTHKYVHKKQPAAVLGKKKKSRRTFYFDVDNRGLIQDRTLKREREKETDCVPVCV